VPSLPLPAILSALKAFLPEFFTSNRPTTPIIDAQLQSHVAERMVTTQ